jgi:hypothetical protein
MSMSVGASSNALSYLQSLLAQATSGAGIATSTGNPLSELMQSLSGSSTAADPSASATAASSQSCPPFGSNTMAALISLQGESASGVTAQSPSQLFAKIDTNGDGQISKSEFETALGSIGVDSSTADSLFAKLDTNDDGSISQSELAGAKPGHGHHGHHMRGGGAAQSGGGQSATASSSSTSADETTTQSTTNPDGSTTTTITYNDGSVVSMTTPVATQNSGGSSGGTGSQNNANLLERLIQLQSQLLSGAVSTISSLV